MNTFGNAMSFDTARSESATWYHWNILTLDKKYEEYLHIEKTCALRRILNEFSKEHKHIVSKFSSSRNYFSSMMTLAWQKGYLPGKFDQYIKEEKENNRKLWGGKKK